jgi:hypothetical protein
MRGGNAFLLPRLRGRIEVGEAEVLRGADIFVTASTSPTLPSPASGGGNATNGVHG